MHAFSIVATLIFIAGYSTARWDLVTRLYELAIFAWDHGVISRAVAGVAALSVLFVLVYLPIQSIASYAADLVCFSTPQNYLNSYPSAPTRPCSRCLCTRTAQAARIVLVGRTL